MLALFWAVRNVTCWELNNYVICFSAGAWRHISAGYSAIESWVFDSHMLPIKRTSRKTIRKESRMKFHFKWAANFVLTSFNPELIDSKSGILWCQLHRILNFRWIRRANVTAGPGERYHTSWKLCSCAKNSIIPKTTFFRKIVKTIIIDEINNVTNAL